MSDWRRIEQEIVEFFETEGFVVCNNADKLMCADDFGKDDVFNATELARRLADVMAKT